MYGSSNTAPQNDYFKGGSFLTHIQTPEVQLVEEPNLQRRISSNSKYNGMSTKFFPVIYRSNRFTYSKDLRSLHDKTYTAKNLGKNKISSRIGSIKSKNARRKSKTNSRAVLDVTESIENLFNKSGLPLEYFKKSFQISLDSKEDSPEISRTKNWGKWRKKNLSHRTRMKNKGHSFKTNSQNFLKRPNKNENRFMQKSKKRSIGLQSRKSALPLDAKYTQSSSKCQPLESLNLFQNDKFGNLFDPDIYKECLLLHKDNKVELLIENKEVSSKFLGNAINGDIFSVFKVMDRLPGTILYESEVPDDRINLSNNIQMPFKNTETGDDIFLPIGTNNLPIDTNNLVSESITEEMESSRNDEYVANIHMFPNNIGSANNLGFDSSKIDNGINENFPLDQMPIKQSVYENLPPNWPANSPIFKDNRNYVQIESKGTLAKITFTLNTTSKEQLDFSNKNFKPTPASQSENPFAISSSNYLEAHEKQISGNVITNIPALSPPTFVRTEFPNIQSVKAPEKLIFGNGDNNIPSLSPPTFVRTEFPNIQNVKASEKLIFGNGNINVPVFSPPTFARTEFPNLQVKEEQVFTEITKDLYSPSKITTTKTGPQEIKHKEKQAKKQFPTEKTLIISSTQIPTSSLKSETLETVTITTPTEELLNETEVSILFTANTNDIHIVITEPIVTQAIPEAIATNSLKESTRSDYNIKNPPMDIIDNEEKPETDIKMLKMHYRHPHGTIEPEIRHRRQ